MSQNSLAKLLVTLCAVIATFGSPQVRAEGCGGDVVCPLGERGYHVLLPDDWDGVSELPVLVHFHGWKRQGDIVVNHPRIADATRVRGVLLVAPNGERRSWRFTSPDSVDVPFAAAVLEDVRRQWPIDEDRIYVSGYSWGGSMAWRVACSGALPIAEMLSISGTFYDQTERCAGPLAVRHVHGLRDTVMDYPFGADGDQNGPVALWLRENGCRGPHTSDPWAVTDEDAFERRTWQDCDSGSPVRLDIHSRGHFIPLGWIARQLDEILAAAS